MTMALFGMAVGLYYALRGLRLAQASGYRFYQAADSIQAVGLALWFTVMAMPQMAEQMGLGGNRHFVLLGATALGSAYVLFKGKAAAKQADAKRWQKWEQAFREMPLTDRLVMRFPQV